MDLQIGLVGLPNAGKSTLFNALTASNAAVAGYPFTTIEPNQGIVAVSDPRLARVYSLASCERAVPATVEFWDIAGLVKGASKGEGLGNQFLGHIRNVDAIVIVLRCFQDADVPHVTDEIDPREDLAILDLELTLADLTTVERRLERVQTQAKAHPRDYSDEVTFLDAVLHHLNAGHPARLLKLDDREPRGLGALNLLTAKPRLLVANVGEESLPDGNALSEAVCEAGGAEGAACVVMCAQLEAELAHWTVEEAQAYRSQIGLPHAGTVTLIQTSYRLLNLITFFTATGNKEVRAWSLAAGTPAIEAAGRIHSDIQRGFIRAEVVSFADLDRLGSFAAAREKGVLRLEGREYIVQDGDVIHFRFNV